MRGCVVLVSDLHQCRNKVEKNFSKNGFLQNFGKASFLLNKCCDPKVWMYVKKN